MSAISLMIKPASSLCNMACKYCFYRDVSAGRENRDYGIMAHNTADALIEKTLNFADGDAVSFVFQGGEPTLAGLAFFEYFTQKVKTANKKNSRIFFSLQTNGIAIDSAWADFFSKNGFLIGLSLDGAKKNNKFRLLPNGENSFIDVINAAEVLKKHKVEFNILTVLTGYCAKRGAEIYSYFRSKGFKYLQFIPCLRPFGSSEQSEMFMTGEEYADFLIKVFDLYVNDYLKGQYISVRQFDNWVRLYLGGSAEQCGMNGFCSRQFVAESNGNIYPCDFYCTDEYLLGDIHLTDFDEMSKSDIVNNFLKQSVNIPEKCRKCRYYGLCRAGGCKRTALSEDYCEAYKKFFSRSLPLFKAFQ